MMISILLAPLRDRTREIGDDGVERVARVSTRSNIERFLARLEPGQTKEVLHQPLHAFGVARNDLEEIAVSLLGSASSSPSASTYPRMAVNGVRNSCDTFATKSRRI